MQRGPFNCTSFGLKSCQEGVAYPCLLTLSSQVLWQMYLHTENETKILLKKLTFKTCWKKLEWNKSKGNNFRRIRLKKEMGLNKRDIRDKKEEYLHGGYLYFGRVLFGIGLVSNRSTFKYPTTFLPPGGGVSHTFFTVHSCDRATDRILSGQPSTEPTT